MESELKIFLKAIEEVKPDVHLIPLYNIEPLKLPACKKIIVEVWSINGKKKVKLIESSVQGTCTTESQRVKLYKKLNQQAIVELLKYYGI